MVITKEHSESISKLENILQQMPEVSTEELSDRVLSTLKTPYDEILQSPSRQVQHYLDLIRVRIALSSGLLSPRDAYAAVRIIENQPEGVMAATGRYIAPWSQEIIERLIDNIAFLRKGDVLTSKNVYAAIVQGTEEYKPQQPPTGWVAEVFRYFVHHPLASFSDAARALGKHRSTVKSGYQVLRERHSILALGLNECLAYGIRIYSLFFEPNVGESWDDIQERLISFPFTKTLNKAALGNLGYVSFTIPNSRQNNILFRASVKKVSERFFDYASLHTQSAMFKYAVPSMLINGRWTMPEVFETSKLEEPTKHIPVITAPKPNNWGVKFTTDDFIIAELFSTNMRQSAAELQTALKGHGYEFTKKQIAYRISKVLDSGVLDAWTFYARVGFQHHMFVEIVCNESWQEKLLKILKGFPDVFILHTDRGLILWLESTMEYLVQYSKFLCGLSAVNGIESVKPILESGRAGGKMFINMYEELEFGKHGFSESSDDVDLAAYVL